MSDYNRIANLESENARLRAALKPVLDVDNQKCQKVGYKEQQKLFDAVREAKRIYNESEVKHEAH